MDKPKIQSGPKTNKATLALVQIEYVNGSYNSIAELASRYGINKTTLDARIRRENWEELRLAKIREIELKLSEKRQSKSQGWIDRVVERSEKDWNIIDKSIDNIGSEVDPDTMLTSVRARKLLDDMARRSLGLVDPAAKLDLTTGGQSIGESLVSAIAKLREKPIAALSQQEEQQILEAEIVDDASSSGQQ